jgi:hypothetical protein
MRLRSRWTPTHYANVGGDTFKVMVAGDRAYKREEWSVYAHDLGDPDITKTAAAWGMVTGESVRLDPLSQTDIIAQQIKRILERELDAAMTETQQEALSEEELRTFCKLHNPGRGEAAYDLAVYDLVLDIVVGRPTITDRR